MQFRKHQREVLQAIDGIIAGSPVRNIVVNACPGSGKSALPLIAGKLITAGLAQKIAWICPRSSLQDQGQRNFLDSRFRELLGHNLVIRASTNEEDPARGTSGFCTTMQAVGVDKGETVLRELRRRRYVLVIDEGHHVADGGEGEEAWIQAIIPLYEAAAYRLIMSGTMSRHDGKRIAFIPYRQTGENTYLPWFEGRADTVYIEYPRTDALRDRAIIPLSFVLHDGLSEWEKDGRQSKAKISTRVVKHSKDALFTALHTGYARELLDAALAHWMAYRKDRPSSRFLAVAANIKVTQEYTAYLKQRGFSAVIATSDDDKGAAKAIKAYKAGKIDVLVTCQVAYEGLDCPSISHIACLTRIRSLEWITQMCGRAVRIDPCAGPYETQRGYIFAPADRMFVELAAMIEADQGKVVAYASTGAGNGCQNGNLFGEGDQDRAPGGITPLSSRMIGRREVLLAGRQGEPEDLRTPKEMETELRQKIEQHVRTFAFNNRIQEKKLNFELYQLWGKPRAELRLDELSRCYEQIQQMYPLSRIRGTGHARVPTKAREVEVRWR
jgi:superfamily II DNA or RNA helicase